MKYLLFIFLLIPPSLEAIELGYSYTGSSNKQDKFSCSAQIHLSGEIKSGDADYLKRALSQACNPKSYYSSGLVFIEVLLNSKGGDVLEAIKMGRAIRDKGAYTGVINSASCLSSCVFVFAGGAHRVLYNGKIGIHRPYFTDLNPNASLAEIQRARFSQKKLMSEYIEEMDISQSLIDAMMAVPPDQIKLLNDRELESYRLTGADAAYDEKQNAQWAKTWNLTSSEYRKRDAIVSQKCGGLTQSSPNYNPNRHICVISVYLGISETEAQKISKRYQSECKGLKGDVRAECIRRINANI